MEMMLFDNLKCFHLFSTQCPYVCRTFARKHHCAMPLPYRVAKCYATKCIKWQWKECQIHTECHRLDWCETLEATSQYKCLSSWIMNIILNHNNAFASSKWKWSFSLVKCSCDHFHLDEKIKNEPYQIW